jgi:3-phenylpropionate/trans-cinnamate dioxygenase ferredoxin reductase component
VGPDGHVLAMTGSPAAQNNGLLTDELCRTSAPDVYAAGDVANHLHRLSGRVRVEHYNNAEKNGMVAAR